MKLTDDDLEQLHRLRDKYLPPDAPRDSLDRLLAVSAIEPANEEDRLGTLVPYRTIQGALKARRLSARGSHEVLSARLAAALTPEDWRSFHLDRELFVLTTRGNELIAEYRARLEQAWFESKMEFVPLAMAGKLDEVASILDQRRTEKYGPDDFLLPARAMTERATEVLRLDYSDLRVSSETQRTVAAVLAVAELGVMSWAEAGRVILRVVGRPFPCQTLTEWMLRSPIGYAMEFVHEPDPEDEETEADRRPDDMDYAQLYAMTKVYEGSNLQRLRQYLDMHMSTITILADNVCQCCFHAAAECGVCPISDAPRLPHHWGCRCIYQSGRQVEK